MKINVHFFLILILSINVFFIDILIYCFKLDYVVAAIISFIVAIYVIFINRKKIKIESNFEKMDFIFLIILFFRSIVQLLFMPDNSYDTKMYHVYLQENPFINKINFDFFPGRTINSYLYPLGDRIFYLSRVIFGYRFGAIISYYSIIVVYYQIKLLVQKLTKKKSKLIPICATMIMLVKSINAILGTYYIDNFSMLFIIQLIYMAFFEDEFIENKKVLYMSFLISGILVGIKVSNFIVVFLVYLYIVFKNLKSLKYIKVKDFPICLFLFLVPFLVYFIDNLIQTGSPIFPYYNNFFKSQYFAEFSWHDVRYDLANKWYAFIWPIVATIESDRAFDGELKDYIWLVGYVICILYSIFAMLKYKKIKGNKLLQLSLFTIIISIIWRLFLMGYVRYVLFLPILYIVIIISLFVKILEYKNKILKSLFITCFIFINCILLISNYVYFETTIELIFFSKYIMSINSFPFTDRDFEKVHINGAWLVLPDDSMIATLLREDGTPIYNLSNRFLTNEKTIQMQEKLREKELYYAVNYVDREDKINCLNEEGFEIIEEIEMHKQVKFLSLKDYVNIYKVKYNENSEEVIRVNEKYLYR